jgi:hypothetical protein
MTQEERELLLRELGTRIGTDTKLSIDRMNGLYSLHLIGETTITVKHINSSKLYYFPIEEVKPFLRPLSNMTDEEREEFRARGGVMSYSPQHNHWALCAFSATAYDWLNENYFDYRGLIQKGLALEAPEGMYSEVKFNKKRK